MPKLLKCIKTNFVYILLILDIFRFFFLQKRFGFIHTRAHTHTHTKRTLINKKKAQLKIMHEKNPKHKITKNKQNNV
jgi:hypothetical protein